MDADIGLVGLGTMGSALALNIAEKGFRIAVFNRTGSVTATSPLPPARSRRASRRATPPRRWPPPCARRAP